MKSRVLILLSSLLLYCSCEDVNSPPSIIPTNLTNIQIASLSANSLKITWHNNNESLDKIIIKRSVGDEVMETIATLDGTDSTFTDNNLSKSFSYNYSVIPISTSGDEPYNNTSFKVSYNISQLSGKLSGHTKQVTDLAFSQDGKYLASGSWDGSIKIWDISNKNLNSTLREPYPDEIEDISFTYDEKYIAGASDGELYFWDIHTASHFKTYSWGDVSALDCSPIAPIFAVDNIFRVKIINYLTDEQIFEIDGLNEISDIQFSHNGKLLAIAFYDSVKVYSTDTWILNAVLPYPDIETIFNDLVLIRFSHNDNILAAGYYNKKIIFWDLSSKTIINSITIEGNQLDSFAFNEDDTIMMIGGYYKIFEYDNVNQLMRRDFYSQINDIMCMVYSPDGQLLVNTAFYDILLWKYGWYKN